jgi:nucleoside-diphosphate-sugar epimerase
MKSVLIIGGGFIAKSLGSHFDSDHDLSIITRREFIFSQAIRGASLHSSLADFKAQRAAPETLIFCTGPSSLNISGQMAERFKKDLGDALKYASDFSVDTFVYISSGGAIYQPSLQSLHESSPLDTQSAYACFHQDCEDMVRSSHAIRSRVSLRLGNPFGRYQNPFRSVGFVSMAMHSAYFESPLTLVGDGMIYRDFFHIDYLGEFLKNLQLNDHGFEIYNFGSGRSVSLLSIVERVSRIAGKKIQIVHQPIDSVRRPVVRLDITKLRAKFGLFERYDLDHAISRFSDEYSSISDQERNAL